MLTMISLPLLGIALIGCLITLSCLFLVRRFAIDIDRPTEPASNAVTILKPLHGAEPGLYENLASFIDQDYPGPVQVVFGVTSATDPALPIVRRLIDQHPEHDLAMVIGSQTFANNGKVANLMGMSASIRHDLIVLSDSDMRVTPDYLAHVAEAATQPNVGLVTCLYRGEAERGLWSALSSMAIDFHFFPSVLLGMYLEKARPCMGATMAFSKQTLEAIGGFAAFGTCLADDYAIGEAVRATGQRVVIGRQVIAHRCTERSFTNLFQHELRWARTLRTIDPAGFAGSFVTNPLPFAMLAATIRGFDAIGLAMLATTLMLRIALQWQIERCLSVRSRRWLLSPLRDVLSFAVFCASFRTTDVTWRGSRYRVSPDGTIEDWKGSRP
jgi:ceramide glucosyltransferase